MSRAILRLQKSISKVFFVFSLAEEWVGLILLCPLRWRLVPWNLGNDMVVRTEAAMMCLKLSQHCRKHLFQGLCRSCGREFRGYNEFLGHFRDDLGCVRKRVWESEEEHVEGPAAASDDGLEHVDNLMAGGSVWKPMRVDEWGGERITAPPIVPLSRDGFDKTTLDLLVHDLLSLNDVELEKRFVSKEQLNEDFRIWLSNQSFFNLEDPNQHR